MKGKEKILALMTVVILTAVPFASLIDDTDAEPMSGSIDDGTFNTNLAADMPLISISTGEEHTVALRNDGTVWAWGNNDDGKLGNGTEVESDVPVQVMINAETALSGVVAISTGQYHTVALDEDGHVWAWGYNRNGQLGDGTTVGKKNPTQVENADGTAFSGVTAISAGNKHTVALVGDDVYIWGNSGGEMRMGAMGMSGLNPVHVSNGDGTALSGVVAISAGSYHTAVIKNDSTVWTWGSNGNGQLGDGTDESRSKPVQVMIDAETALSEVKAISAGNDFTVALKDDNTVWTWGRNSEGQLGDGTDTDRFCPVQVMSVDGTAFSGVVAISAGSYHTAVLKNDNTVWTWGDNSGGQLGDGTDESKSRPVQVKNADGTEFSEVAIISAGYDFTVALDVNGNVWAWGYNGNGQLGDGTKTNRHNPIQSINKIRNTIMNFENIVDVSSGYHHTVALDKNGDVWAWGSNDRGQLGDGSTGNRVNPVQVRNADGTAFSGVIAISAGNSFTVALKNDNTVWTWGNNGNGQLGNGTSGWANNKSHPVQVRIDAENALSGVTAISAGSDFAVALKDDNTVWAWGSNGSGRLGNSLEGNAVNPVQVQNKDGMAFSGVTAISAGGAHTFALVGDSVYAWGYNGDGRLADGTTESRNYPVQVLSSDSTAFSGVTAISAGEYHTAVLKNDNTVWAWGYNKYGQLGDGTDTDRAYPVQVMIDAENAFSGVNAISAGSNHTTALDNDGNVWAWGHNQYMQAGDGTDTDRMHPVQVQNGEGATFSEVITISAGKHHTVALDVKGSVWAWGNNEYGQLGDGTTENRGNPVHTLRDSFTVFTGITSTSAGDGFTVALDESGNVWTWGHNLYGQLGDGTIGLGNNKSYPTKVMITETLPLSNVTAISTGYRHIIALDAEGHVWTWGYNEYGQLGYDTGGAHQSRPIQVKGADGAALSDIIAISGGGYHTVALDKNGNVWAWGYNHDGQLGDGTSGIENNKSYPVQVQNNNGTAFPEIIAISAGINFTVALDIEGDVWAWGYNETGQLGDGTTTQRDNPVQVMIGPETAFSNVTSISAGYYHTVALDKNGNVWAWGYNYDGQLGDGTNGSNHSKTRPVQVMIDAENALSGVFAVSAGGYYTVALKDDNTAWAWGNNLYGQLGDGTNGSDNNKNRPVQVMIDGTTPFDATAISAGLGHVVALVGCDVYTWGDNQHGQLGDGTTENRTNPVGTTTFEKLNLIVPISVENVKISSDDGFVVEIDKGTIQMIATVTPDNATNTGVKWSVESGKDCASVGTDGLLTLVAEGSATVRATSVTDPYVFDEKTVIICGRIISVTEIAVSCESSTVMIGRTVQMIATVSPENATAKNVTWSISEGTGATIDGNGLLTAIANGQVTIKAMANDGSGVFGEMVVNIVPVPAVPVTEITVSCNGDPTVTVGGTLQMIATVTPGDADDKTVVWTISDGTEASIDGNGLLTASAIGTVTVRATANDGSSVFGEMVVTINAVEEIPSSIDSDDEPDDLILYIAVVLVCVFAVVAGGVFFIMKKK